MENNGYTVIKKWYKENFPEDNLASEIKEKINFNDVAVCLTCYHNFYELIGVADSVVRERIFKEVSKIAGCSYNCVYNWWLKGTINRKGK